MNILYKPLVLIMGILCWHTIKCMDRSLMTYPITTPIEDIAASIHRSGQDTLNDKHYMATINQDTIDTANRIINIVTENNLTLIDTSNLNLITYQESPFINVYKNNA